MRGNGPGDPFLRELLRPLWDRRYTRVQGGCGLLLLGLCAAPFSRCGEHSRGSHSALSTVTHRPVSACGQTGYEPTDGRRAEWSSWSCRSEAEAGGVWSSCLDRAAYTAEVGQGCPGRERCCPASSAVAAGTPGSSADLVSDWTCLCYSTGVDEATSCRPTGAGCTRLARRAGRAGSELESITRECTSIGQATRPDEVLGGSAWEPSSVPGWTSAEGCLLE